MPAEHADQVTAAGRGRPLVVVDGNRATWLDRVRGPVSVLTLGVSAESYQHANRAALAGRDVTFVSAAPLAPAAQEAVQDMYPAMLHRVARSPIGGRSLLERLTWRGLSLWWLSDISEKSALRGGLVNDIYALALIELAREKTGAERVHVDSGRTTFRDVVAGKGATQTSPRRGAPAGVTGFLARLVARRTWWTARLIATKVVAGLAGLDAVPLSKTLFLTVHPLNWRRPYESEGRDRIYGRLPEVFASWRTAGFVAWLSTGPLALWRTRRETAAVFQQKRIFPLLAAATYGDIAASLSASHLGAAASAFRALPLLDPIPFLGYDIAPLVREEISRSLLAHEMVADTVIVAAARRLAATGEVEAIIHWGEWQPVEKAIWAGVRGSRVATVAVQHSASSPMFLNYRFVQGELSPRDTAPSPEDMPLPSLFATTGHFPREAAVAAGFPPQRARVCGPVRYPELAREPATGEAREAGRARLGIGASDDVALLVTASKRSDNVSMLIAFAEAVSGRRLTVIAKCHPFDRMEDEIEATLARSAPTVALRVVRDDTSLAELLALADIMVGNSSASGLEAVAAGVIPVFFHNPHVYDVSVLYSLRDSILLAANAHELNAAITLVFGTLPELAALRQSWPEALHYLLDRLDGGAEERLLDFVKSHTGC